MIKEDRVRSLRVRAGLSQSEVAKAWGKSRALLSLIESGRREPLEGQLDAISAAIAAALSVKTKALLKLSGEMAVKG